jgi:pimeloyl-ACP methyl ester carboxylesterase
MEHHGFYAAADGLQLFYRDWPGAADALPVLCMHGLTRNSADFIELAGHLAPRHRVIAPDVRGRGRSGRDPDWRNYHPAFYTGDMWRLLDELRIGRVALVGTSMGGIMAMLMAVQQPQRVAAIVLNDIGPAVDPAGLARIAAYAGVATSPRDWREAEAQMRARYGEALPGMDDAFWHRYTRRSFREGANGAPEPDYDLAIANRFGDDGGDATEKLWQLFAQIRQPLLVLRGERSDILSAATVARMAQLHPGLRAVEVRGRGHVPLLDEPEVLAALDALLADLAGSA